jgi:hypothetical protein
MSTYQSSSDIADRNQGYLACRDVPLAHNDMPPFVAKTGFMVAVISNGASRLRESRIAVCFIALFVIYQICIVLRSGRITSYYSAVSENDSIHFLPPLFLLLIRLLLLLLLIHILLVVSRRKF